MTLEQWLDQARTACLDDAFEFCLAKGLCDSRESLDALAARWSEFITQRFTADNPDAFYAGWVGDMGAANLPVNIRDQFSRDYIAMALFLLFGPPFTFTGRLLDFGCGTAAISLSFKRQFVPRARLYLADVENLPAEFVRYRIERGGDSNVMFCGIALEEIPEASLDLILCIDVLEHLPNPSEVFALLDHKLRPGGILILQAPWGGHPEHLDCAPIDWVNQGGHNRLEDGYRLMMQMAANCLSGVYWKRLRGAD